MCHSFFAEVSSSHVSLYVVLMSWLSTKYSNPKNRCSRFSNENLPRGDGNDNDALDWTTNNIQISYFYLKVLFNKVRMRLRSEKTPPNTRGGGGRTERTQGGGTDGRNERTGGRRTTETKTRGEEGVQNERTGGGDGQTAKTKTRGGSGIRNERGGERTSWTNKRGGGQTIERTGGRLRWQCSRSCWLFELLVLDLLNVRIYMYCLYSYIGTGVLFLECGLNTVCNPSTK